MRNGDIKRCFCDCRFRLNDVAVSVVRFGNFRFRVAFTAGGYGVHLPKDVREDLLLALVHRGNLLRVVRVCIRLDCIDRKHILPHGSTAADLHIIISYRVFLRFHLGIVIGVDFLHGCLHRHSRAGILTGKEYPENRAADQCNQANYDNDRNGNPAACGNSSDQCFCCRNDCFDCGNRCFNGSFYTGNRCLGCGFGGLCSFLRCFHRSLCGFLRRLCRLLCSLDCRFRGLDRPLCGFGCTFPGSLDGFLTGRPGRLFDRFFRLLDRLDGLIPGGADSLPFHRLSSTLFTKLLNTVLCFGHIPFRFFQSLAPLLIKLVRRFVRDTVNAAFHSVGGVLLGIMLIRVRCVFCLFLRLHIGGAHTVCGDCRFVDLLDCAFYDISRFNISH